MNLSDIISLTIIILKCSDDYRSGGVAVYTWKMYCGALHFQTGVIVELTFKSFDKLFCIFAVNRTHCFSRECYIN